MKLLKKIILSIPFFIVTICIVAVSEATDASLYQKIGFAPFSIAKKDFDCDAFLDSISRSDQLNISFLYNTFGRRYRCLNTVLNKKNMKTLQIHLINEPGHRNDRLEKHEFLYRYKSPRAYERDLIKRKKSLQKRFTSYVKNLQKLLNEKIHPRNIQCLISPGLESNINDKAAKVLVEWTRELFPECLIVWNPLKPNDARLKKTAADFIEQHGEKITVTSPCIVNTDGTDIAFPSRRANVNPFINSGKTLQNYIISNVKRCEYVFLWISEYNCINSSKFIPPTKRKCINKNNVFQSVGREVYIAQQQLKRN